jgi:hypothetical protein
MPFELGKRVCGPLPGQGLVNFSVNKINTLLPARGRVCCREGGVDGVAGGRAVSWVGVGVTVPADFAGAGVTKPELDVRGRAERRRPAARRTRA